MSFFHISNSKPDLALLGSVSGGKDYAAGKEIQPGTKVLSNLQTLPVSLARFRRAISDVAERQKPWEAMGISQLAMMHAPRRLCKW